MYVIANEQPLTLLKCLEGDFSPRRTLLDDFSPIAELSTG